MPAIPSTDKAHYVQAGGKLMAFRREEINGRVCDGCNLDDDLDYIEKRLKEMGLWDWERDRPWP